MPDTTRTTATRKPRTAPEERLSLAALIAALAVTYVWFFSQALTYLG